ncbi:helix-turn-helix transcriptional regulator, partial [Veillonella sp.]
MQFYKNLKRARVRMGKSQIEVAKAVGISNAALSNYETGYREPDLDTLCALSRYYG